MKLDEKSTRRNVIKTTGVTGVAALAGCLGGDDTGSVGDAGDSLAELTYARTGGAELSTPAMFLVDTFSEQAPHINEDYAANITVTQGTSENISVMGAGEADAGIMAFGNSASAVTEGTIESDFSIVVPEKWYGVDGFFDDPFAPLEGSGITDFDDLTPDTRIATNVAGAAVDVAGRVALQQNGIDPETDVNMVEVNFGAIPSQVREGAIDMGVFVQPFWEENKEEMGDPLFDTATGFDQPILPLFTAFRDDYIDENPEVPGWFVEDFASVIEYIFEQENGEFVNRESAMQTISNSIDIPTEVLDPVFFAEGEGQNGFGPIIDGMRMEPENINPAVEASADLGFISEFVDMGERLDNSYLPDRYDQPPEGRFYE